MVPTVEKTIPKPKAKNSARSRGIAGTDPVRDFFCIKQTLIFSNAFRMTAGPIQPIWSILSNNESLSPPNQILFETFFVRQSFLLNVGLAIFQHGFAPSDKQLADSRNSLLSAAAKLQLPEIVNRFERDTQYVRHLTN